MGYTGRYEHDVPFLKAVAVVIPQVLHIFTLADKQNFIKCVGMQLHDISGIADIAGDLRTLLEDAELLAQISLAAVQSLYNLI